MYLSHIRIENERQACILISGLKFSTWVTMCMLPSELISYLGNEDDHTQLSILVQRLNHFPYINIFMWYLEKFFVCGLISVGYHSTGVFNKTDYR